MKSTGGHAATPNSETTEVVTPGSQNATSTVPSAIGNEMSAAQNNNDSEATKIVKSSPGV